MSIIPIGVKRFVSSPRTAEIAENTIIAVSVETGLKMVGRPMFIMADKQADSMEKKKFAATKEMLYQGICLTLYLSVMQKYIKPFFYNVISKNLSKNPEDKANIDEFNRQYKIIEDKHDLMKSTAKKITDKVKRKEFKNNAIDEIIKLKEVIHNDKRLRVGKGAKELSAIIGSILMLTVVAPQISHFIIHPIMKALGFNENSSPKH